jgi:hypothetical protein
MFSATAFVFFQFITQKDFGLYEKLYAELLRSKIETKTDYYCFQKVTRIEIIRQALIMCPWHQLFFTLSRIEADPKRLKITTKSKP